MDRYESVLDFVDIFASKTLLLNKQGNKVKSTGLSVPKIQRGRMFTIICHFEGISKLSLTFSGTELRSFLVFLSLANLAHGVVPM